VLLALFCTVACRGAPLSSDVTELGEAPAVHAAPQAAAALRRTSRGLDAATRDLTAKMGAMRGGEQAKQAVQDGFDIVKQINAVTKRTAAAAKRARDSEAIARTAAEVMGKPDANAVEVSSKLRESLGAQDRARGFLRRARSTKLEAKKLSAKAEKRIEKMDTLNILHANAMVRVHDEAQYALDKAIRLREHVELKMKRNKGGVKMEKIKEKAVEADAAAGAASSKVQHEKDTEKLKLTKAKDANKLSKAKASIAADEAQIKSKAESIRQEEALTASSMSKADQFKLKLQQEKRKFELLFAQSKIKAKASKQVLASAKKEENSSFEKVKVVKTASEIAVADSSKMKVVVQKGAPIDPSALTAARKAAHLLNDLDIAKRTNEARHESVIEATKAYTKAKITHRVLELRHESVSAAAAQAKQRAQKKKKKKGDKIMKKARQKGEERSERMMLRARAKARKMMEQEKKKAEAFKVAELKKVSASKLKKKPAALRVALKKKDPDQEAADQAISREMSTMMKAEGKADMQGDEVAPERADNSSV